MSGVNVVSSSFSNLLSLSWVGCSHEHINEQRHERANTVACAPSEDYDQPGHLLSLIRALTIGKEVAY